MYESSNETVFIVSGTLQRGEVTQIYPVSDGTGYVIIKDSDGKAITALPITVIAERKPTTLTLDKYSITLSNSSLANDKANINVTLNDQYGEKLKIEDQDINVTLINTGKNEDQGMDYEVSNGEVQFCGKNVIEGAYQFKIQVGDFQKVVVVTVKKPSETAMPVYRCLLNGVATSTAIVDSKITNEEDIGKGVTIAIAEYRGDILYQYVDIAKVFVPYKLEINRSFALY